MFLERASASAISWPQPFSVQSPHLRHRWATTQAQLNASSQDTPARARSQPTLFAIGFDVVLYTNLRYPVKHKPACNFAWYSFSPVGGALNSVFRKKALPTGLPVGPDQSFNWESSLRSRVPRQASRGSRFLFNKPLALSTSPFDWGVKHPLNSFLFYPILHFLAWEMQALITLDSSSGGETLQPCEGVLISHRGFESICQVACKAFPSLISKGSALAGWSACNLNLHSVTTVSQVFLFVSLPLLCAATQSSLPEWPQLWCKRSPNGYHSGFRVIFLISVFFYSLIPLCGWLIIFRVSLYIYCRHLQVCSHLWSS